MHLHFLNVPEQFGLNSVLKWKKNEYFQKLQLQFFHLLIESLPGFEFPRHDISSYVIKTETIPENMVTSDDFVVGVLWGKIPSGPNDVPDVIIDKSYFLESLTEEEINIIAILMMCAWVNR